jgi:hypothetical protein
MKAHNALLDFIPKGLQRLLYIKNNSKYELDLTSAIGVLHISEDDM